MGEKLSLAKSVNQSEGKPVMFMTVIVVVVVVVVAFLSARGTLMFGDAPAQTESCCRFDVALVYKRLSLSPP